LFAERQAFARINRLSFLLHKLEIPAVRPIRRIGLVPNLLRRRQGIMAIQTIKPPVHESHGRFPLFLPLWATNSLTAYPATTPPPRMTVGKNFMILDWILPWKERRPFAAPHLSA
jgi:hypothetical protein